MKKIALISSLFLCINLFGNPNDMQKNSTDNFSLEILKELNKNSSSNIFISPYSIKKAFSLAYLGADGKTKEEIKNVMDLDENQIKESIIYENQLKQQNGYELNISNNIWIDKTFDIKSEYEQKTNELLNSEVKKLDFKNNSEEATNIINNEIENQTKEKIKDLIPKGVLNSTTRTVLTNAIYLKADWEKVFDKNATNEDTFKGANKEENKIKMMHKTSNFNYFENDLFQSIQIPYKNNHLKMVVLLPKDEKMSSVLKDINKYYDEVLNKSNNMEVALSFPKFEFKSESISLKDKLIQMGIKEAFLNGDFKNLSDENLTIGDVIHKSFIKVDEEGSEMASATGVIMIRCAMFGENKIMNVNRPFIFFITNDSGDKILFEGVINNIK